ncbi:UDP-glucuronosyl/UDP-glucosyltransferase [Trema orientale]|uniref:UDP-glucuronosyl/UDP-glucosyltransferase n=1 Tax=Trema orientale TaxID=63057 RepID=A0A2P5FJN9_TREOI|nr:UDP-glucuronosyl/UDP-glucosyltransferase [Trema orientale]
MDFFYVETLISLKPRAVKAIFNGLCIPDGVTPSIHCIGPSLGSFLMEQLREIAFGLERNGQRFLWMVQSLVSVATSGLLNSNLDSLLVGEFLEKTKKRDLVVKNWTP